MIITTNTEYQTALSTIETLMNKFPDGANSENDESIALLAEAIEHYEERIVVMPMATPIKVPETLTELLELQMSEKKLQRHEMARLLGLTDSRFTELMLGKRKINLNIAKNLYKTLGVDPKFILEKL